MVLVFVRFWPVFCLNRAAPDISRTGFPSEREFRWERIRINSRSGGFPSGRGVRVGVAGGDSLALAPSPPKAARSLNRR